MKTYIQHDAWQNVFIQTPPFKMRNTAFLYLPGMDSTNRK